MKVKEKDVESLNRLPDWVKCMHCGGKPEMNNWLIEVVKNSNALIHQSCAALTGKYSGLNIGLDKGE